MYTSFAIVDVETTGGSAQYNKIIEIGIVVVEHGVVTNTFHTLLNPHRKIPPFITSLTGISQDMVDSAPTFAEVSTQILELTAEKVFVAHSVSFDYNFIKHECEAAGIAFERKKLCSIKLTRKLVPDLRKYGLASLCKHFGVINMHAHSALGDAEATAQIFLQLMSLQQFDEAVHTLLKRTNKQKYLPEQFSETDYENLPEATGVYYFHDRHGKIIYTGKAINIKERVKDHITGSTHTREKTLFQERIHNISYVITGNELMALLCENESIKKYYPKYNKIGKQFRLPYGIFIYQDQNSYYRLSVAEAGKYTTPLTSFKTKSSALTYVVQKAMAYELCLKLCNILAKNEVCSHLSEIACPYCHMQQDSKEYNKRFEKAFFEEAERSNYIIQSQGRSTNEKAIVLIENGKISGYGYINYNVLEHDIETLKSNISSYYDTADSQAILEPYLKKSIEIDKIQGYKLLEWK
ncbi:MAG: exonuclease domain-containing protein [Cytophagales bacterium]|nr:exonuclease domain-containing protein [Cytophagales bacterium]